MRWLKKFLKRSTRPAAIAPSKTGDSRPKHNHDAVMEVSHPPQLEDTEENQAHKGKDARNAKGIKLSARALELLAGLSAKRISITDIELGQMNSQDGGTFADVAVATLIVRSSSGQGGRRVAVKKLRLINDMTEEKLFSAFVHELRVLDTLSHPHVVEIIGFVEEMEGRIAWLIFPWEENGNLRHFLRSGTWELPERVSLIDDVICGLEYLHTRQPPIRHGDLKSLNILVNSYNRAVITDFGSARIIEPGASPASYTPPTRNESAEVTLTVSNGTLTLTGPGCSARWAPPEFLNENVLELASDIWAFGWIAWEAITDCFPFEEVDSEVEVTLRVLEGRLPMIHNHCQLSQIHSLCGIMQKCWKLDPRERVGATECRKAINWIPRAIPFTKCENQSAISSAQLLLQIGEIHGLQARYKEALEMCEQGLAIAQSADERATLAGLLLRIADIHRLGSKDAEAEASYAEALAICETIGDDRSRANALRGLGELRGTQSKYMEAETSYAEALVICKRIGDDQGRADALRGLGTVRHQQSKYIEAEGSYAEALAMYMSTGSDLGRANALRGLGDVRRARSKYVEAEAVYAEALAIYKTIGHGLGRANALQGLGHVRRAQSKYIEAEACYAEALAICKTIGYDQGRANALRGLGTVGSRQSKYIEAEASYAEALTICKTLGFDRGRASALQRLGRIQRAQGKYIEAEASYADALTICETIGYNRGRANALQGLGHVRQAQSKYIEAEAFYTEALVIYKHIGQDLGRVNCSLRLADIRIHQARYAEAKAVVEDAGSISKRIGYSWGMNTSDKLLDKILKAEGSPNIDPLTSDIPTSLHAEDSAPPASLPETDQSLAASL